METKSTDRRERIDNLLRGAGTWPSEVRDSIAAANVLALLEIADAVALLASEIEKAGWSKMSWTGPE